MQKKKYNKNDKRKIVYLKCAAHIEGQKKNTKKRDT